MNMPLDYKKEIKNKVKELSRRPTNPMTLKKLARHLQIQYTYLSKILNSEADHLKEDLLYEALNYLEFSHSKIDFLMNLRVFQGSTSPTRKEFAEKKVALKKTQYESGIEEKGAIESQIVAETEFMFDPYSTIVLASLSIPNVRKDPRRILDSLNLTMEELKAVLDRIEKAGFIERGEDWLTIEKVNQGRFHYRPDHQFTRIHQQQLKSVSQTFLTKIGDTRKRSFMVTFVADQEAFLEIKEDFHKFLNKVETIAKKAKPKKTYQLNFDLFDWL